MSQRALSALVKGKGKACTCLPVVPATRRLQSTAYSRPSDAVLSSSLPSPLPAYVPVQGLTRARRRGGQASSLTPAEADKFSALLGDVIAMTSTGREMKGKGVAKAPVKDPFDVDAYLPWPKGSEGDATTSAAGGKKSHFMLAADSPSEEDFDAPLRPTREAAGSTTRPRARFLPHIVSHNSSVLENELKEVIDELEVDRLLPWAIEILLSGPAASASPFPSMDPPRFPLFPPSHNPLALDAQDAHARGERDPYPPLILAVVDALAPHSPGEALHLIHLASTLSTESYVRALSLPLYNLSLRLLWTTERDVVGILHRVREMRSSGVGVSQPTRALVDEIATTMREAEDKGLAVGDWERTAWRELEETVMKEMEEWEIRGKERFGGMGRGARAW